MVDDFIQLLKLIPAEKIIKVKIVFDKIKGLPDCDCMVEDYPVIFYTDMDINICIFTLLNSFKCYGPNDLLKVLKLAGFNIQKDLITGNNEIVHLEFRK
jgi:hypothetical protein